MQKKMKEALPEKASEESARGGRRRLLQDQLQELIAMEEYDGAAAIQGELKQLSQAAVLHTLRPSVSAAEDAEVRDSELNMKLEECLRNADYEGPAAVKKQMQETLMDNTSGASARGDRQRPLQAPGPAAAKAREPGVCRTNAHATAESRNR